MRPQTYRKARLTDSQLNIIKLMADGLTAKEIAKELTIGQGSVRNRLLDAYRRLDARNSTHAVMICYRAGLLNNDAEVEPPTSRERLHALADTLRDALADIEQLKHLDDAAGDLP